MLLKAPGRPPSSTSYRLSGHRPILSYNELHWIELHCIALHSIALHCITTVPDVPLLHPATAFRPSTGPTADVVTACVCARAFFLCVCLCVRVCVRACVRVCACVARPTDPTPHSTSPRTLIRKCSKPHPPAQCTQSTPSPPDPHPPIHKCSRIEARRGALLARTVAHPGRPRRTEPALSPSTAAPRHSSPPSAPEAARDAPSPPRPAPPRPRQAPLRTGVGVGVLLGCEGDVTGDMTGRRLGM